MRHLQYMLNVGACPVDHLQTEGVAPAASHSTVLASVWKLVQLVCIGPLRIVN